MLSKFKAKNNFGRYTWQIKLHSLFEILIHETEANSYVVEFNEFKWIKHKTHFSFISNKSLEMTIYEAFERVYIFFQNNRDFTMTLQQKDEKQEHVIRLLREFDR